MKDVGLGIPHALVKNDNALLIFYENLFSILVKIQCDCFLIFH